MNDLSHAEQGIHQGIPVEQLHAITTRADIRRRTQELRTQLQDLTGSDLYQRISHGFQTKHEQEYQLVIDTMNGNLPPIDDISSVSSQISTYVNKGRTFQEMLPNQGAFFYAKAAALQEESGISHEKTLLQAKECLEASRKQDIPRTTPADFLSEALIIGIQKKSVEKLAIPSPRDMAIEVQTDPSLVDDYALVLDESEREAFLYSVAGVTRDPQKVRTISARMDRALSMVVDMQEPQHEMVLRRATTELAKGIENEIIMVEPTMDRPLVKTLAQTLQNLGGKDAKMVLNHAATELVKEAASPTESSLAYAARLVRTLAETDELTGGTLAIDFMAQGDLPPRYFAYFRDYLQSKGLLAKMVDSAGKKWSEDQCQGLYVYLQEHESAWSDPENVTVPFENGTEVFGIKRMLVYAGRPDVGPHDALFAFPDIVSLFHASGLKPKVFYNNILSAVSLDTSTYENGNSYGELNRIAQSLDLSDRSLQTMRRKLERYKDVQALHGLHEYLDNPQEMFSSWVNLKQFVSFTELLDQTSILDQLKILEHEAQNNPTKQRVYAFYETLALRKGSKVDMNAVMQLWQNPESFFERSDVQIEGNDHLRSIHEAISPNNYPQIQCLDLTIEEFRDALIDGTADHLQLFPPMEILYSVTEAQNNVRQELALHEQAALHVGSKTDGTLNTKLFHRLKQVFSAKGLDVISYLQGKKDILEQLSATDQDLMQQEIYKALQELPNLKVQSTNQGDITKRYRVNMLAKGNPEWAAKNNDMANCMPFGAGKSNDFWGNQTVGMFAIEEERGGAWRSVVADVITPDMFLGSTRVSELVKNYDMQAIIAHLPDSVLGPDRYANHDNAERAINDKSGEQFIEAMLINFFQHYIPYLNEHVAPLGIKFNEEQIVIGQGYSDLRYGKEEDNVYLPSSLIGYSDKLGPKVDVIRLADQIRSGKVIVEESVSTSAESTTSVPATGLLPLTPVDTMAAAVIESRAYPRDMQEGVTAIQNYIAASRMNNEIKGRPQLSLKYVDSTGTMRGYLTAWEGIMDDEPVVYVEDIAADQSSTLAGGRLMQGFMQLYKQNYIDQEKFTPIFIQAREETTYQILQKHFAREAEKMGVRLEIENLRQGQFGSSRMYNMRITPVPNQ